MSLDSEPPGAAQSEHPTKALVVVPPERVAFVRARLDMLRDEPLLQAEGTLRRSGVALEADAPPTRLPEVEAILTPEQVATVLQIPRKTVIALCADGRLHNAFKAGRRWRIPGSAVRHMAGVVK